MFREWSIFIVIVILYVQKMQYSEMELHLKPLNWCNVSMAKLPSPYNLYIYAVASK